MAMNDISFGSNFPRNLFKVMQENAPNLSAEFKEFINNVEVERVLKEAAKSPDFQEIVKQMKPESLLKLCKYITFRGSIPTSLAVNGAKLAKAAVATSEATSGTALIGRTIPEVFAPVVGSGAVIGGGVAATSAASSGTALIGMAIPEVFAPVVGSGAVIGGSAATAATAGTAAAASAAGVAALEIGGAFVAGAAIGAAVALPVIGVACFIGALLDG